jgi:hypothetical protein
MPFRDFNNESSADKSYGGSAQNVSTPAPTPVTPLPLGQSNSSFRNYGGINDADNQDWWDVTGGAALYGGADIMGLAARRLNRFTGAEAFKDISDFFEDYKKENPTYGPTKVADTLDLITNPKALSSRLFGGASYLALGAAGVSSGVGIALTFGAAYAIESERAYEDALATGATEDEATNTGNIVGLVNGGLQVLQGRGISGMFTSGVRRRMADAAVKDAIAGAKAMGITGEVASRAVIDDLVQQKLSTGVAEPIKHIVKNSLYGVLQGATGDLVPNLVYGRQVGDWRDFADRRMQDAVGAGVASAVFGMAGKAVEDSKTREQAARQQSMKELDVYARGQVLNQFADKDAFKGDDGQLKLRAISTIMDARAQTWAKQTGRMPEEYYPSRLMNEELLSSADAQIELKQPGDVLGYFSKLEDTLNNPEFTRGLGKNDTRADLLLKALQNPKVGVTKAEMQWTGLWDYLNEQGSNKVKWDDVRQVYNDNRVNIAQLIKSDKLVAAYKDSERQLRYDHGEWIDKDMTQSHAIKKLQEDLDNFSKIGEKRQLTQQEQDQVGKLQAKINDKQTAYDQFKERYDDWYNNVYKTRMEGLPSPEDVEAMKPSNPEAFDGEDLGRDFTETLLRWPQYETVYDVGNQTGVKRRENAEAFSKKQNAPINERQQEVELAPSQGHYDEKNIIVDVTHTTQDLKLADGSPLTVRRLVEIQSDWDQKARKRGYKDEESESRKANEQLFAALASVREQMTTIAETEHKTPELLESYRMLIKKKNELEEQAKKVNAKPYDINPMPFKDGAWVELGLKSFLMQAVQDGHDAIRLPTGREVADRWGTEGNLEFYDNVVAKTMLKLVRRYDKNAKVEQVEVAPKPNEALTYRAWEGNDVDLFKVEQLSKTNSSEHVSSELSDLHHYMVSNQLKSFSDFQPLDWAFFDGVSVQARRALEAGGGGKFVQKTQEVEVPGEKVPILRLSPEYKAKLISEGGYTLFQRKALTGKDFADRFVSVDPSQPRTFKAIRLNNGETYVYTKGNYHADMVKDGIAMGYFKPEDVKATGTVLIMGDLVGFSGDNAFVPEYTGTKPKVNAKGGRENENFVEDINPNDVVHVVDDKLFQTNKGSFTLFKDGMAAIKAFQNADFSTAVHELAHLFELDLPDADKLISSQWTGVNPDGSWRDGVSDKVKEKAMRMYNTPYEYAREKFARGFEQYIREGKAPTSYLTSLFEKFKKWMSEIYSKLRNSPVDVGITTEMRGVYDRLLAVDTPEVVAARNKVIGLEGELKLLGINVGEKIPNNLDEKQKAIFSKLIEARKELKQTKQSQLNPDNMSPTQRRQLTDSVIASALSQESDVDTDKRIKASSWLDPLRHFFTDRSTRLARTPMGNATREALDDAESYRHTWRGKFEVQRKDLLTTLDNSEKAQLREGELQTTDGIGYFGYQRRLLDTTALPEGISAEQVDPESTIGRYKKHLYDINLAMGKEAEKYGVLQTLYGVRQPYEQPLVQRMPRFPTEDMYKILKDPGGDGYRALVKTIQHYNPGMTLRAIDEQLNRMVDVKKAGILEEARKIKYMPDHLKVNGKTFALFHTDPAVLTNKTVEVQAQRIGLKRQFGEQGLKNATEITTKSGEKKPYYKFVDRVAEALGVTPLWNESRQMQVLSDYGWTEEAMTDNNGMPLPLKDLQKLARVSKLQTRPLIDEVLSNINNATTENFSTKFKDSKTGKDIIVYKRLNQIAKELGGVKLWDKEHTLEYPPEIFLAELKRRLSEEPHDYVAEARQRHIMQGGYSSDFDTALALAQGVPVYWQANGPLWKATRFISNLIGAAQTSTSVVANLPQTLVQVPALVGMKNYQQAMKEALTHYNFTEAQMASLGAFTLPTLEWGGEAGDRLVAFSRNVGKLLSHVTGMEGIARWNNTVAAKAVDLWFDALTKHPNNIGVGDVRTLKRLRLTNAEIQAIKSGTATDDIRAKAVQNGVAITQFVTEAPYRRGLVENIPLLKMMFAYSSYAMGTARATRDLIGEWKSAKTQGDWANVIRKTAYTLVGSLGAGLASQLLRDAVKGDVSRQDDETLLAKAGKAILEAQLLGPVQRMVDPFRFDNGDTDKALISTMPQLAVIRDLINAGLGRGKFGEFGVAERFAEAAKKNTPLARGFVNWYNNLAYPELVEYRNTIQDVAKFKRDFKEANNIQEGQAGESVLNPDYYPVYDSARKGDEQGAGEAAKKYYETKFEDYRTNPQKYIATGEEPKDIILKLRSSLVQRSPLNMSPTMMALYLQSKDEKSREAAIKAHIEYMKTVEQVAPK